MSRHGIIRRVVGFILLAGLLALPFAGFDLAVTARVASATPNNAINNFGTAGISNPYEIVTGPDGALWFTNYSENSIGRIDPATNTLTTYTNAKISLPFGITAGPDGALWFTNEGSNSIGRITTSGVTTSFSSAFISIPTDITTGSDGALWFANDGNATVGRLTTSLDYSAYFVGIGNPEGIAAGSDNALWVTGNNRVVRMQTDGTVTNVYNDPSISSPNGITPGPDGALWFTNQGNNSIGSITTSGVISNFPDPSIQVPQEITTGPDGALWFTSYNNSSIGRITTGGTITSYTRTGMVAPYGIVTGPDGALWFTNQQGNSIGRIDPTTHAITNTNGSNIANPGPIATGSDGALWFTNQLTNSIGRTSTDGVTTSYTAPTIASPDGIAAGSDGALWFTNQGDFGGFNGSIGRIDPTTHVVTNYTDAGITDPVGIVAGPDGALWFTNEGPDSIGRIDATTHAVTIYTDGSNNISLPSSIVEGPDGALWFINSGGVNQSIGRIDATTHVATSYHDANFASPTTIAAGPDNGLWFTNSANHSIERIDATTHAFTSYVDGSIEPLGIAASADGGLWFTSVGSSLWRIDATTHAFTSYPDSNLSFAQNITAGPDGAMWFDDGDQNVVGRMDTGGGYRNYIGSAITGPQALATGPDGALWFTNIGDGNPGQKSIGRIGTNGAVTTYSDPSIAIAWGIAAGPSGENGLWFTDGNSIGRIDATTHAITNYPDANISDARGITLGSDNAMWFANCGNNSIGRIDPFTHAVTKLTNPDIVCPTHITSGSDGDLWFTDSYNTHSIGQIDPGTNAITIYTSSNFHDSSGITSGPDGALWFVNGSNSIGRMTTGGLVTSFTDAGINGPTEITAGSDGALWFVNAGNNTIGRITVDGTVTTFTDPTMQGIATIASGPDGGLWFTNNVGNSIGRIDSGGVPSAPSSVTAFAGHGQASVSWSPPASDGAFPITDYSVSVTDGAGGAATGVIGPGTRLVGSTATNFTFTGLTNDTVYRFTVAAVNSAGTGTTSTLSNPIAPLPPGVGDINTVAGNGTNGYGGDGGIATAGKLASPQAVAVDPSGNIVIADYGNSRIRVVAKSRSNPGYPLAGCVGACTWTIGRVYTIAGNGTHGSSGDGGPATSAQMTLPTGVAVDPFGDVVIADYGNGLVRLVAVSLFNPGYSLAGCGGSCTWTPGDIYTVAGSGFGSYNGDGIPATTATLDAKGVAVDSSNNVLLTDFGNALVRVVAVSGSNPGYVLGGCSGACTWTPGDIYSIAGTASPGYSGDGGSALSAAVNVNTGVTLDNSGNVLLGDGHNVIRVIAVSGSNPGYPLAGSGCGGPCTWTAGNIYTVAGTGTSGYNGDGISATNARIDTPSSVAIDPQGNLIIVDSFNGRERVVAVSGSNPGYRLAGCGSPCTWATGDIYTIAGNGGFFSGDGGPSTLAGTFAAGVGIDASRGDVYLADSNRIREIAVSSDSREELAATNPPIGATVTVPSDAAWTTQIYNSSTIPATNVVVTIAASANNATPLSFDNAAINLALGLPANAFNCVPGGGGSEFCFIGSLPALSSVAFTTFVSTAGRSVGDTLTGTIAVASANSTGDSGTLGPVNVISSGSCANCTTGVAVPGAPLSSPAPTTAIPTQQTVTLPANAAGSSALPPLQVTLQSFTPSAAEAATDKKLCPVATGQTQCSGQISSVVANFSKYNDPAHPIAVKIVQQWGSTVPSGRILMEKNTGGDPLFLLACVQNGFTHQYNTPCVGHETVGGTPTHKTTTDTVLFTGLDVHFARRVSTGGTVIKPPAVPTAVTVTAGLGKATLKWRAPTVTNGAGVTSYVVTELVGGVVKKTFTYSSPALTQTVSPLVNGTVYTFKVAARNVAGTGVAAATAAVKVGTPLAPTGVTATAGHTQAIVHWTAPAGNGTAAISGYVVTPYVGTVAKTAHTFLAGDTAGAMTGLATGTTYTFKVQAKNAIGVGSPTASTAVKVT